MRKTTHSLEEGILLIQKQAREGPISIAQILQLFPGKGQACLLILLSFPFCLPLQIPGLSTPFGLAIAFIGLRMAFHKRPWLPKKLLTKQISSATLQKITRKALWWVRKMERWCHPRLQSLCQSSYLKIAHGLILCALGLFLALPLPIPLSNILAAWGILLLSLGVLEDDGAFIIAGYVGSILTALLVIGIFVLSVKLL